MTQTNNIENTTSYTRALGIAPEARISALSDRFAARGLVQSALLEAEEQIAAEEKTRELAPGAYRLSLLSEGAVQGLYRKGKDNMSGDDLLRYVEESRRLGRQGRDFSESPSIYETACVTALEPVAPRDGALEKLKKTPQNLGELKRQTVDTVKRRVPLWFNFLPADTSSDRRKFPLSAFAAIIAIAVSMMLIVASAIMVTSAETKISKLNRDISKLSAEVTDLRSDLESGCDLMEIRRIAVEEYGMVEQEYLKMDYITLKSDEEIEAFESKRNRNIGLSAILSAIGLKK